MKIYKFNTYLNESKNYKKYNDMLKNLGVIDDKGNIDLKDMTDKIEQFLTKPGNKDEFLKDFGDHIKPKVEVENVKIKVKKLKPSQSQIYLDHILSRLVVKDYDREQILNGELKDHDILISGDGHIIDGHHRWASAFILNPDCVLNCTQIDLPIKYALPLINAILNATDKEGESGPEYKINIYDVIDDKKKDLIKKMNTIISKTIKNGVDTGKEELKSEESWETNESLSDINTDAGKSFYKNIKKKLDLDKHSLKYMRKNIKKLPKPDEGFSDRKDMPQLKEKDAKKLL